MNSMKIFTVCFGMAMIGYISILGICATGTTNVYVLLIPAFLIMSSIGMLNVIITIFLANTVDYGEFKNHRRDESIIFSMQTFVVKLASGISALIASIVLSIFNISSDDSIRFVLSSQSKLGLRMCMTLLPILVLIIGYIVYRKHYILTDEKLEEMNIEIKKRKEYDL